SVLANRVPLGPNFARPRGRSKSSAAPPNTSRPMMPDSGTPSARGSSTTAATFSARRPSTLTRGSEATRTGAAPVCPWSSVVSARIGTWLTASNGEYSALPSAPVSSTNANTPTPSSSTGTTACPDSAIVSGTSARKGRHEPSAAIARYAGESLIIEPLRGRTPDAADRAVAELDGRVAEPDVEGRRELAKRRARQRAIVDHDRLEQLRILDALRDQVALVRL